MKVVVIGADAAGASAASALKRALGDEVEVVILERQRWTSYSACSIPYWIAGEVDGPDRLIARTPDQHRANGLDLRTGVTATAIDPQARTVTTDDGQTFDYDHLVIGTGAVPRRPPLPGIDLPGVQGVQTIDDGLAVLDLLDGQVRDAVVVGAGYIGIEVAEALSLRGLNVTVVDAAEQPMATLDPDMGCLVADAMAGKGITFHGGEPVLRIAGTDRVQAVETPGGTYPADVVLLGMGVRPNTELAAAAGLPLGESGGILTTDHMAVEGHDNIWAGGDCVEVLDRVSMSRKHVPLGTHANKHGRIIAANIAGGDLIFPGIVGTAISKLCSLEISRTGLKESEAAELGFDPVAAGVGSVTKVGFFPGAEPITVKVIAQRGTGRLLGCQIAGGQGAGKRIDAIATAIWYGMTAEEFTNMDLAYSPPFSPVWDPVQIATRVLTKDI